MKSKDQSRTGKRLQDYPAVPGTPPPEQRKDKEVAALEKELDRERTYLSSLRKENEEIEKILRDLDREIGYVKTNFPQNLDGDGKIHAGNEYWFKYEAQMEVNRKLERERRLLESEIRQMEDQGTINLDSLTQSELILYVKQLERTKTDLLSELRAKEWSLDKQAKDYHHLKETRKTLEAQIRHYDGEHALYNHYKRISCPSASCRSSQVNSARRVQLRRSQGTTLGGDLRKTGSVSHEDISGRSGVGVMFRSLDESKLQEPKTSRRRTVTVAASDGKGTAAAVEASPKGSTAAGSLPELSKHGSKSPPKTGVTESRAKVAEDDADAVGDRKQTSGNGAWSVATAQIPGSQFTITIRIMGRIVSNPSVKCTISGVDATVVPK